METSASSEFEGRVRARRARRGLSFVAVFVAAGVLTPLPLSASPGAPIAGFGAAGVEGFQARGLHGHVAVTVDGTIFLAAGAPGEMGEAPQVSILRYSSSGALLGETVVPGRGTIDSVSVADIDAAGRSVYLLVAYGRAGRFVRTDLLRVRTSGELDPAFGGDGSVTLDKNGQAAISARPDGGGVLVVGGQTVRAYDETGRVDMTFSDDGKAALPLGSRSAVLAMDVSAKGQVAIVGIGPIKRPGGFVVRLDADGSVSSHFGRKGLVWAAFPRALTTNLADVDWAPRGKLIISGSAVGEELADQWQIAGRIRADGSMDAGFSDDGWVGFTPSETGFALNPARAAVQPDGKVIVAGGAGRQWVISRYREDGTADKAFGSHGQVEIRASKAPEAYITAVVVDTKRKRIVIGGVQVASDGTHWTGVGAFDID